MIQVMHPRLSSKNFKLPQEIQSTLRGKVSNYCRAPIIFGDFLKRLMSFFGCLNKSPSHKSAYKNQIFIKKIQI